MAVSKRRNNCDHTHWHILPGNVIMCGDCGEAIDREEVDDWIASTPTSGVTFITQAPLTTTNSKHKLH